MDASTESLVNRAVSCLENNRVASMAEMWARLLSSEDAEVVLSTGRALRGCRHPCFEGCRTRLLTKCYDLEAACKWCPLADSEGPVGVIAVEDPDNPEDLKYSRIYASLSERQEVCRNEIGWQWPSDRSLCLVSGCHASTTVDYYPFHVSMSSLWVHSQVGDGRAKDRPFNLRCKAQGVMFHQ